MNIFISKGVRLRMLDCDGRRGEVNDVVPLGVDLFLPKFKFLNSLSQGSLHHVVVELGKEQRPLVPNPELFVGLLDHRVVFSLLAELLLQGLVFILPIPLTVAARSGGEGLVREFLLI